MGPINWSFKADDCFLEVANPNPFYPDTADLHGNKVQECGVPLKSFQRLLGHVASAAEATTLRLLHMHPQGVT